MIFILNFLHMSKFDKLCFRQKVIIYNEVNWKGWFSIDFLDSVEKNLTKPLVEKNMIIAWYKHLWNHCNVSDGTRFKC